MKECLANPRKSAAQMESPPLLRLKVGLHGLFNEARVETERALESP